MSAHKIENLKMVRGWAGRYVMHMVLRQKKENSTIQRVYGNLLNDNLAAKFAQIAVPHV